MEANPVNIVEYFNGEKQSVIPLFQRPYTWDRKNWQTLWDDLLGQYDAGLESTHFMGAVVSVPARSVPVGVNKHLIIDGQQRLTTFSILLRAIREYVGERDAARIDDYLVNRHQDGADQLKLLPTQSDRDCYRKLVLRLEAPTADSQVGKAFEFFCEKLRGKDLDDKPIDPERALQTARSCLQVVMINLGDSDDPYLIFESLNYKGEPLTQADLVRNYVLMKFRNSLTAGGEQERAYTHYWKPLEGALGTAITEFLRHYTMKSGEMVKRGGVYAAIKSQFAALDQTELVGALEDLHRHGLFYRSFTNPGFEERMAVRRRLTAFTELDFTTSYPLLLRLFDATENGHMSVSNLERMLQLIESFSVRRSVCHVPTHALNKLFLSWAKRFDPTAPVTWLADAMASGSGGQRWPRDDEFAEAFKSRPQYGRKHVSYLLRCFEQSFAHKEAVDLSEVTIEHVMPQTLSDEWKHTLGKDYEVVQSKWLDTMGNLTLTAYNTELGNQPFTEKKKLLQGSHIDLNRWIVNQELWDADTIRARAKMLFDIALELWPGPGAIS